MPRPPGLPLSCRRGWEAKEHPRRLPTEGREVRGDAWVIQGKGDYAIGLEQRKKGSLRLSESEEEQLD